MKRFIVTIAAAALVFTAANAQSYKFAHVNFQELVQLMPEMDSARVQIEAANQETQETYGAMVQEFQDKYSQYEQKSAEWSAAIRQNYNEIADMCRKTAQPVFLTKNGEGDLVVMDIDTYSRREQMLKLREELLSVEEDRAAGKIGYSLDELDSYLDSIIDEA